MHQRIVGASIARPCSGFFVFAESRCEFVLPPARTANGRPYIIIRKHYMKAKKDRTLSCAVYMLALSSFLGRPGIVAPSVTVRWTVTGAKKPRLFSRGGMLALPIFPGSRPPSIVGANELNFCVRDGNRWTLTAINTNYLII